MSGTADLLLHPHRLRIVQAFLGRDRLTTADLRALLPDIPTATLYRQITTLLDGGCSRWSRSGRPAGRWSARSPWPATVRS